MHALRGKFRDNRTADALGGHARIMPDRDLQFLGALAAGFRKERHERRCDAADNLVGQVDLFGRGLVYRRPAHIRTAF